MKNRFYYALFALLFSFLLVAGACAPDDSIVYPDVYEQDTIIFQNTRYFVLSANAHTEIGKPHLWRDENVDSALKIQTLLLWPEDERVGKVELLSDSTANMYLGQSDSAMLFEARIENAVLFLSTPQIAANPYQFNVDQAAHSLYWGWFTSGYLRPQPGGDAELSILESRPTSLIDINALVSSERQRRQMQAGDTVLINQFGVLLK